MTSKEAYLKVLEAHNNDALGIEYNDIEVCNAFNILSKSIDRLEELEEAHDHLFIECCKYIHKNEKLKNQLYQVKLALKNAINGGPVSKEVKELVNSKGWLENE